MIDRSTALAPSHVHEFGDDIRAAADLVLFALSEPATEPPWAGQRFVQSTELPLGTTVVCEGCGMAFVVTERGGKGSDGYSPVTRDQLRRERWLERRRRQRANRSSTSASVS